MKTKPILVRAFAEEYISGKAILYICAFCLRPGDRVLILARKSNRECGNNLDDQVANLWRVIEAAGAVFVGVYRYTGSGWYPQIGCAAYQAKQLGATILLAETTDRIVRNLHFHSAKRPELQATDEQLAEAVRDARHYGIKLMSHLDPDASPSEVRSYQTKRGHNAKDAKPGRPKKRTKEQRKRLAKWLSNRSWVIRDIAAKRMVGASKSTVGRWINE